MIICIILMCIILCSSEQLEMAKQYFNNKQVMREGGNGYYITHTKPSVECKQHTSTNVVCGILVLLQVFYMSYIIILI